MKAGDRFGMLVVHEVLSGAAAGRPLDGQWCMCRCDCGKRRMVRSRHLRFRLKGAHGHFFGMSCGCKRLEFLRASGIWSLSQRNTHRSVA